MCTIAARSGTSVSLVAVVVSASIGGAALVACILFRVYRTIVKRGKLQPTGDANPEQGAEAVVDVNVEPYALDADVDAAAVVVSVPSKVWVSMLPLACRY